MHSSITLSVDIHLLKNEQRLPSDEGEYGVSKVGWGWERGPLLMREEGGR